MANTHRTETPVLAIPVPRFPSPNRIEVDVAVEGAEPKTIWFESSVPLAQSGTALLPMLLPIAMRSGSTLIFETPQDARALLGAKQAQRVLNSWYPQLTLVGVQADKIADTGAPASGVGSFFSGGVDSFYSAIEASQEITHLIFVIGFDINESDKELAEKSRAEVRQAADALGKELLEVRTNVRQLSDSYADWGNQYHGAALATVGHLLSEYLGRILIPSTYQEDDLFPWGSHPALDHLWSGSRVDFVHHGASMHRPEKIAAISKNPVAMNYLRVCWENRGGAYNCGRCEKCLRTMIGLRAAGALESCRTLPHHVDPRAISIRVKHGGVVFARENLMALRNSGVSDSELEKALMRVERYAPAWELASNSARKVKRFLLRRR